jgi:hypothetical protein
MAITTPSAKASGKGPIILDGYDTAKNGKNFVDRQLKQTIQAVGNFSVKYTSPVLKTLKENDTQYTGIDKNGAIYLVGFKLESVIVSSSQQIDNSKVVPLVNGDSITLTNICKAGTLSFNASRTAGGLNDGDCVSVFDYVRSQGDVGGTLELSWLMNSAVHKMIFSGVCVKNVPPLTLAGNDVPDYNVQLTYSNYTDSDSPAYNTLLGK